MSVNVDDIQFKKQDGTGTGSLKEIHSQVTGTMTSDINALKTDTENIKDTIGFVSKSGSTTNITVNDAAVNGRLTVGSTATFNNIEFIGSDFRPRNSGNDMIAYFTEVYVASGAIGVANELSELRAKCDKVDNLQNTIDSLTGAGSGSTISEIKSDNAQFNKIQVEGEINVGTCFLNGTGTTLSVTASGSGGQKGPATVNLDTLQSNNAQITSATIRDLTVDNITLTGKINAANIIMPNEMDLASYVIFLVSGNSSVN